MYWRQKLSGDLPVLQMPLLRQRPTIQSYAGADLKGFVDPDTTKTLLDFAGSHGVTLNMLMLTNFFCLLHQYTRQNDIIIGTPVAGRNREELENVVGLFLNTLPLRINCSTGIILF